MNECMHELWRTHLKSVRRHVASCDLTRLLSYHSTKSSVSVTSKSLDRLNQVAVSNLLESSRQDNSSHRFNSSKFHPLLTNQLDALIDSVELVRSRIVNLHAELFFEHQHELCCFCTLSTICDNRHELQ